jgi:sigma-54 dependent transcriptional regulator, acetoin dehydrogenase operon transcriptional activator AcoR
MKINEELLNFIFNSLEECIVIVDENGFITMMSNGYKEFLSCDNPEGKHITEVVQNTRLHVVAKTGIKEFGELQDVNGHRTISMRVPIILNGKVIGAIGKIMFKDLSNFKMLSSKISNLEKELQYYKNELDGEKKAKYTFNNLLGKSISFLEVVNFAKRAAKGESSILITGESGTGKELFAQAIHNGSKRSLKPFVKINCAAIPGELFESEMFGYEEGAFTGAKKSGLKGKFELANGGTILLDEIGDMPLSMQVKLLRVLQEREIVRVGSNETVNIDVRVIAATNKSLPTLIEQGKFREDLYYRLNVMHLNIPPLRDRVEDIELLSDSLRIKLSNRYGIYSEGISKEALVHLKGYNWPGNVRQLENVIERAINLLDTELLILSKHLPEKVLETKEKKYIMDKNPLKDIVDEVEKELIISTLEKTGGNKNETAKILGLSRTGLYKKLRRLGLF